MSGLPRWPSPAAARPPLAVATRRDLPWTLRLVDARDVNAFSGAGWRVFDRLTHAGINPLGVGGMLQTIQVQDTPAVHEFQAAVRKWRPSGKTHHR